MKPTTIPAAVCLVFGALALMSGNQESASQRFLAKPIRCEKRAASAKAQGELFDNEALWKPKNENRLFLSFLGRYRGGTTTATNAATRTVPTKINLKTEGGSKRRKEDGTRAMGTGGRRKKRKSLKIVVSEEPSLKENQIVEDIIKDVNIGIKPAVNVAVGPETSSVQHTAAVKEPAPTNTDNLEDHGKEPTKPTPDSPETTREETPKITDKKVSDGSVVVGKDPLRTRSRPRNKTHSRWEALKQDAVTSAVKAGTQIITPEDNIAEFQISGGVHGPGGIVSMTQSGAMRVQEYFTSMQMKAIQERKTLTQQLQEDRAFSRLYITSLPPDTNGDELRYFFNRVMEIGQGENRVPGASVLQVFHNAMGRYAFIELRTAEEAVQLLQVGTIMFGGIQIKIGRPINHNEDRFLDSWGMRPKPPPLDLQPLGVRRRNVGPTVSDGPHKIYAAGFPTKMWPEQIQEIFEAFGPLKGLYMPRDTVTNKLKGWVFAEYADPSVTDRALKGLHGMRILNQNLQVRRALVTPTQDEDNPFLDPAKHFGNVPSLQPHLAAMCHMSLLSPGSTSKTPTRIVVLLGCANVEQLRDDREYLAIYEDIKQGVSKFGNVTSLIIPRPGYGLAGVGRVYVEYDNVNSAMECTNAMEDATYNDNFIKCVYWPEKRFKDMDLR